MAIRLKPILLLAGLLLVWTQADSAEISPQGLVRDTSTRVLSALQEEKEVIEKNPGRLYELVAEIVLPYFDFRRMSQWVLGRYWQTATPKQREQFVREFRSLLVRTYGNALSGYAGEKVSYLPLEVAEGTGRVSVQTEIEQPGSNPIPVTYYMYLQDGGWKVYDVSINGVSLVMNYRSSFGRTIREDGMDALVEQLVKLNGDGG